ncbi:MULTISPECIES: EamA family transporter RarD [Pseudoalteromonas]|uniref:Chloramphenicol-sensitive protein RarD n=1 Tax=Pseudoalteromonas peptidolytica F12-50-A1 TaxID=1315280 RepID=A0A8I0T3J9_9GAMM|nr:MULTISPECIES: EamA family transporter RarD [Pseudoalteromonas]MBE0345183.1 chloramphenicol-sensitive protein RarD [Pseudoalteromonas peptidolytica F12-50-A1]MDW7550235.1 EamA family transporter RarD [Pseudoalteromonas peptidolytica]NLR14825.1 EamA family transporter RarD [Pseudoalteromonas peptidolytica]RXF07271.1 EamA family transporter RarD [Pseudoalteromonas sp. PS5]USD28054.1 EamA family transporter RarD [Pseudoalteromonas sp. SCSIO 43201]
MIEEQKKGHLLAVLAFLMWGLAPIYFKQLTHVDAIEILIHRVIWSVLFIFIIVLARQQWPKIKAILVNPKLLAMLTLTALLLGFNWGLFIWSVQNDYMLDASLGYYINPLLNVLLGMLFLSEKLRAGQKFAVMLAIFGVLLQLISFGSFPIIAFSLAGSFAIYGLLRKTLAVESLPGLLVEALILTPIALVYWWWAEPSATSNLMNNDWYTNILLVSAGVVTTLPLLCFTGAAKRIPYSTLGFFQYIGPSLMFMLAVLFYGEPFDAERAVTFAFIWSALVMFSLDSYRDRRKRLVN